LTRVQSFLKWAGGKRWLVSREDQNLFNIECNRYVEPFLGGGSIYFRMSPKQAILADVNKDLIMTYRAIKNDWLKIQNRLAKHQKKHSKKYYYQERNKKYSKNIDKAAQLIYLNRTCWNGLYRVNKNGVFNVPKGTKRKVVLKNDNFKAISEVLKGAKLIHSDFEKVIAQTVEGDFLFVDPPYTIKHGNNGFIKYNEKIFKWKDQERLCRSLAKAHKKKVKIFMTNAYHKDIRALYKKIGFTCEPITRASVIAGKSSARGKYKELIIKNY